MKVDLRGLRSILRAFDNTREKAIYRASWSITEGGYDCFWELSYKRIPVIDCIAGYIRNCSLDPKTFEKAVKIIMQEYPDVKIDE